MKKTDTAADEFRFDLLRVKLEGLKPRVTTIAVTSSTDDDGVEYTATQLAASFAVAGYRTILFDLTPRNVGIAPPGHPTLEHLAETFNHDLERGGPHALLTFDNVALQRRSSHKSVQAAFATLSEKADIIIVAVKASASLPFSKSVIDSVDAILITVRVGRKLSKTDLVLAELLQAQGERFIGAVGIETSVPTGSSGVIGERFKTNHAANAIFGTRLPK